MPRPHPPPPGHNEAVPCPWSHAALAALAAAPLAVPVDPNLNVVATAALAVYVGCWRSVKAAGPTESMTRKVRGGGGGPIPSRASLDREEGGASRLAIARPAWAHAQPETHGAPKLDHSGLAPPPPPSFPLFNLRTP
jgi:hypothetical protein